MSSDGTSFRVNVDSGEVAVDGRLHVRRQGHVADMDAVADVEAGNTVVLGKVDAVVRPASGDDRRAAGALFEGVAADHQILSAADQGLAVEQVDAIRLGVDSGAGARQRSGGVCAG